MSREEETVLQLQNASKTIAYRRILEDITLRIRRGQAWALVGPNGAGKTTLLRLIGGLSKATGGTVETDGRVGFVGHQTMLYEALTASENLRFFGTLAGVANPGKAARLLDLVGLGDRKDDRVGTYSRGMMQRLSVARALLPDPDLLILDEPFTGLDDVSSRAVRDILVGLRDSGTAMVVVSHELSRLAGLVDTVAFLVQGRVVATESAEGMSAQQIAERYRLVVHGE